MNIDNIQKSLVRDFRDLLLVRRRQPRAELDQVFKILSSATVSELTAMNRAFTKQLASDPAGGEYFTLQGASLRLAGDPEVIRGLRQVLGFFSRLHANVTEEEKLQQLREAAVRLAAPAAPAWTSSELSLMRNFISRVLGPVPDLATLVGKHGPGAVATREKGLEKIYFKETYQKLDDYLGWNSEFLFRTANQPHLYLERKPPVTRVIAVPKDALSIRTISCEPLSMMFLQQGIMHAMYQRMCYGRWGAHFPFLDQLVQRARAKAGSECYAWGRRTQPCTIDLSSASDDVKKVHVEQLFPAAWADLLLTVRSDAAHFEALGTIVPMETFAPMGAATCFPTEALVFGAVTYASMIMTAKTPHECRDWGVVGDDIVVPAFAYDRTLANLERGGFHPNFSKCCGPLTRFRESCGGDYFEGMDVTYERPRILPNEHSMTATVPMVQLANGLYTRGFRQTARLIARQVPGPVAIGYGPAYGHPDLPWGKPGQVRWNHGLQRYEQKTVVETPLPSMRLGAVDGWEPLFTWFTSGWHDETSYSSRTKIKWCWLPIEASAALIYREQKPRATLTRRGGAKTC